MLIADCADCTFPVSVLLWDSNIVHRLRDVDKNYVDTFEKLKVHVYLTCTD